MKNKIAELNDQFRQGDKNLGKFQMTQGVTHLTSLELTQLLGLIRQFDQFNSDNDPWGEHDFGKVSFGGQEFCFKIDYFDPTYTYHSDDPSDPTVTKRVMTIMCMDEY